MQKPGMQIFLSFHWDDGEFAEKISKAAAQRNDLAEGQRLNEQLRDKVEDVEALRQVLNRYAFAVILLSKNYLNSGWFYSELSGLVGLEKQLKREFIFTVLIDEVPPERIPFSLRHKEHVDLRGKKEKAGLKKLLERIDIAANRPYNKIFIVHGHDKGLKEATARLLEKHNIEAIILSEEPLEGNTIIEKFERHANVHFALALLTPDDLGKRNEKLQGNENPRARQNVILELGYFIGRLGRERVLALCKEDVELPSDLYGIEYLAVDDAEAWKTTVVKSLRAAGFQIDLNTRL